MNLSTLAIKRPVAAIMLTLMVVVVGVYSMITIPRDLMPDIEYPMAMVMTTYGGASPEEVESMVTEPLEKSLASIENLDEMSSYSMENMSIVALRFNVDTDMNFASLDIREKVGLVSDYLPDDASTPTIMKMNMDLMPVMQVYVSGDMELAKLNSIVENNLTSYFERSPGVASVSTAGGIDEEIAIEFSQEAMKGYGLNLSTLSQILSAENINLPSGEVTKGSTKVIVRTMGEFESIEDIKNLPVTVSDYSVVRLGDVSTITRHYADQTDVTRVDGKTAVGVLISKQSDANTVEVSKGVNKTLKKLREDYPNLTFTVGYDSADYINSSISSVASAAVTGALLAILVVFLFLANIKSTLVIAVSIPTSLLATFALMKFRDMSLNLITLCSLTLVVGMLVDNSIVVLENIFRVRQESENAIEAAIKGSKEIFMAVIASTLTTVLVFLPIALSGGMAAMMFSDFCFTIIIALMVSLVVALTVVPMFCSKLMEENISDRYLRIGTKRYKYKFLPKFKDAIESLKEFYASTVVKVFKRKKTFILACVAFFLLSTGLVLIVGWELLPEADEGMISVSISTPYGTPLADKEKILSQVEDAVINMPEVDHLSMTTAGMSIMSSSNGATVTIRLKDRSDRDKSAIEVGKEIEKKISGISGADISVNASSSMLSMFGSNDISLNLMGKDNDEIERMGNELVDQLNALDCVETAELDVTEGSPEIRVKIDRNAASFYGVTAYQLSSGLSNALKGTSSTDVTIDGDTLSVKLSLDDRYSESVENMKQVMVTGSYGTAVPVSEIASFEFDNSPTTIGHHNQHNYITLNVDTKGDLREASDEVMKVIDAYQFPDGYYYDTSGIQDRMMDMFGDLLLALIVAILLVFLILAAQFESLTMPFIVVMAIPFAMSGAFMAMFITNTALSLTSFLGLIVLVGIVVNNSILLVEFINQNKQIMGREEALVKAGVMRLRPILMSCGTTVIGMIPLSLGLGDGGEMLAPMGISIIGGLIASTIVTLYLIPVLYSIIDDRQIRKAAKKAAKAEKIRLLEAEWDKEDEQIEAAR